MTGSAVAIGVDVGGTKIAAGRIAADGAILERAREATPAEDPDELTQRIAVLAKELGGQDEDLPIGVGAAGLVDLAGVVRYAPNVAWTDYPLGRRLSERLAVTVTVDNDANAAAWAEFCVGAGADQDGGLLMLTLGTGVGGGLISGGKLMRGASGLGAEFGHIVLDDTGPRCPCGNRGCLEALASGNAIGRAATAARPDWTGPTDLPDGTELTGEQVTDAARDGDALACHVLSETGRWLGIGIASLVNALDPGVIVIGGGAASAGAPLLEPARRAYRARLLGRDVRLGPSVVAAQLGNDAGMIGAALLAAGAVDRG